MEKPVKQPKPAVTKQAKPAKRSAAAGKGSEAAAPKHTFDYRRPLLVLAAVAIIFTAAAGMIYPMAKTSYVAHREQQQLEAQLAAIEERNAEIEETNEALGTDEGIEDEASREFGWVQDGESSAIVSNADEEEAESANSLPDSLDMDSITAPQTWYYRLGDVVFGVE